MSQKIYLMILKSGVALSFISILLTWRKFYFPYISTKQIYFNILLEILFVFWAALIIKYPSWRPKKNLVSFGLLAFFASLLLSSFFSVDFNLSFWGDVERMLGFFSLLHFLILYFIVITVMRSWSDWRYLFLAFVAVGVIVSVHGIAQRLGIITSPLGSNRIIATIGNAAYVGAYAIFNLFFVFILFFKTKNRFWQIALGIAGFLILLALVFSGTRGAYLGFAASLVVMFFLSAVLAQSKKIKIGSGIALAVIILAGAILFLNADKNFVVNNSFLRRITQINFADATMQTRFISWRAAGQDFKNHPIFGTGLGNYAIIFDKYFTPDFYNFTRSETYFDQAHNNLIDIASTSGLLGLITYLSIFIAVIFYLIRGLRNKNISQPDFIVIIGLITAYFIQNLVVFDSLATYIPLMLILGYVYWLSRAGKDGGEEEVDKVFDNKEIYSLFALGFFMLIIIYQFNIKPAKMLIGTIDGQAAFAKGDINGGVEAYKKALSYNTVLDRDSRSSFLRYVSSMSLNNPDKEKTREILDYAVSLGQANVKYNPADSLMELQLAQALDAASRLNTDHEQKFYFYSDQALAAVDKAIESSPGRIPVYYVKAQIYLTRGEVEKAIETLKYAVSLNEKYYDSACQLAKVYILLEREGEGYPIMDSCLDKGGVELFPQASFLKMLINHYSEIGDLKRIIILYEKLATVEASNTRVWIDLSKLYAQAGEKEKAIESAKKSAELDKSLESSVNQFINGLK